MTHTRDDAESREPIFELVEYALAERKFVQESIHALARARDPLLSQISVEPTSRLQTTQITTDEGVVVEQQPVAILSRFNQKADELIDGRLDEFLATLDAAAEQWAEGFGRQFYDYLSRISQATGNVVDAKDRPFFDSIYEMFEKVDLQFDEEGRIQQTVHLNPADAETWTKGMESLTQEQRQKLDELIERKRQEFNARRRHRRIPRRSH